MQPFSRIVPRLIATAVFLLSPFATIAQGAAISPSEFQKKIAATPQAQIVDVRTAEEFKEGHIANARNLDWHGGSFDKQATSLDKSRPVFVYCYSGPRSTAAAKKLRSMGFKEVYDLQGGLNKWNAARLPLTTK